MCFVRPFRSVDDEAPEDFNKADELQVLLRSQFVLMVFKKPHANAGALVGSNTAHSDNGTHVPDISGPVGLD